MLIKLISLTHERFMQRLYTCTFTDLKYYYMSKESREIHSFYFENMAKFFLLNKLCYHRKILIGGCFDLLTVNRINFYHLGKIIVFPFSY